ncbi:MAG: hypothetical protein J6K32_10400 [Clostridia bacterium]|nr:hypothetical protein [Clostridia bacterium]
MKTMAKRTLLVFFLVATMIALSGCDGAHVKDGIHTCKNCNKKEVYDLGYCKSCYTSFIDWVKDK